MALDILGISRVAKAHIDFKTHAVNFRAQIGLPTEITISTKKYAEINPIIEYEPRKRRYMSVHDVQLTGYDHDEEDLIDFPEAV